MYDDLLRMDLPVNLQGGSSTTLIAFADDVAILATGRTTTQLEEAMNPALAMVARWMSGRSLKLSVSKTEAIMLTTKRGYQPPRFFLDNTQLQMKEHIRYLGVELSKKLGFRDHLLATAEKATKSVASLSRLMPNIGGPKQGKRQLLMSVVQSRLLYAAPVWASEMTFDRSVRVLQGPQRKMALRISCAYRTVSTNAILVVAGVFPIHLQVSERCSIYQAKKACLNIPTREEMRANLIGKWQCEWEKSETGRWTRRLIPDLKPWLSRTFGLVNFHITQFLTGHGCFGQYLFKYKRLNTPMCHDCQAPLDDVEHAIFTCDRWFRRKTELEIKINADFSPETAEKLMLRSKSYWDDIVVYIEQVLQTREEEERQRQRGEVIII